MSTTGDSPANVLLKSPGLGNSTSSATKLHVGPRMIRSCSNSLISNEVYTSYEMREPSLRGKGIGFLVCDPSGVALVISFIETPIGNALNSTRDRKSKP